MSILLVDKPQGLTSFDVIRRLQRRFGKQTKIGHAGTLDPMASGLLIVATEKDTKKLSEFLKLPKVYEAEVLLGVRTDTGDITGKVLEHSVKRPSLDDVKGATFGLVGELNLPVPIYSAVKRQGEALYKKARRGEKVKPPKKIMQVQSVEFYDYWLKDEHPMILLKFKVASGTYIRSLAEEIGRRLGVPATLANLRRVAIGEFDLKGAEKI